MSSSTLLQAMPPRPTLPKPPSTGGAISVQVLNELANVARPENADVVG
jgi:hypothetical protein